MSGVAACSQSSRASKVTQMTNIPLLDSFDFRQAIVMPTFKPKQLHRVNPLSVFNGGRYRIILPDRPIRIRNLQTRKATPIVRLFQHLSQVPQQFKPTFGECWGH
ncbi:hypothetical protein [Laspinema olomoucense]|uniref:Uncharacterized protein n=1 Tax=Laspinema olomoucense D3b TaxID=2953688 RepID=A0ABT2N102_9CYAN|nr:MULTISPECIES: hypothetical protein [unclassified Laspinema]MCT7970833.1 hypothetical protein [Laspinema sp. D3d]MCT7976348.1 hypothetical protein [Laspinema sp. D3b]MCT7988960.1 hypothetical protein [Laspinema sp. D3a]MCT7993777.1 hypothetical protein [Laspinema sp. D3c]